MMQAADGETPVIGNAITSSSAVFITTPITMPLTSKIIVDCWLTLKNSLSGGTDYKFFDFTETNTYFGRQSSDKILRYRYYGNNYQITVAVGDKIVKKIELNPSSRIFTVTYDDGETADSNNPGRAWTAKSQPFRIHLGPNFYVQRVQQVKISDGTVLHDIYPALVDGAVGLFDAVDEQFYDKSSTPAFITNTPT